MQGRLLLGTVAIALAATGAPVAGQQKYPLAPTPPRGQAVSPFFEGWYRNADGTYTLSFGYFNRNYEEVVEIPVGPDNAIEPRQYDGKQPTSFPPFDYTGLSGRRERGVFTLTVPAEFRGQEIVWTLRNRGQTHTVRGSVDAASYQLSDAPMAMGSIPPTLRFGPQDRGVRGPTGTTTDRRVARVGEPLTLTVWTVDESRRTMGEDPLNVTWFKHSGPIGARVTFSAERAKVEDPKGKATTTATFAEPGEYLLRVRADNFGAIDSLPADQCCWTNGYIPVTVQP